MASDVEPKGEDVAATDGEAASDALECQEPDEFYTLQARDTIGRYCQRFLDENALTATEVLHSPRHQQTVSNLPTFVGILQQAERLRGRGSTTLTALVNEVARLTRQRVKDWEPPELKPGGYAAAARAVLSAHTGFQARFILDAALTQHLMSCRSYADKARALIELVDGVEDAAALEPVDRLLGEMVRSEPALASISSDALFTPLVDMLVTLIVGDKALPEEAPPLLRAMETLVRRTPMPQLSDGLIVAFRRALARPDRLTISSVGDLYGIEAVQREVFALSDLAQRLRTGEGYFGGSRTEAALQRRSALLINEDTLAEIIKGRNFHARLLILFALQKMPLSPSSGRAVDAYLKTYFEGRDFAGRLLDCWKERNDKLKGLAEIQKQALTSAFPEEERDALANVVDEIQNAFIRTQRVIAPLMAVKEDPSPDMVLDIIKLAGEGAFCRGKSRAAVAKALYRQVHRPRFIRAFLLGASQGKDRANRAAWLKKALSVVGVPFIDLASLRALVVDDEDGPRNYVASVLSDLGIGNVETAVDGRDALDRFTGHEERFDLIICDWMMPRVSGLEVLRQVREARPDLPFLMVTALATQKAVQKAVSHQVSGYIAKPFTPEQLEEKVFLVLTLRGAPGG